MAKDSKTKIWYIKLGSVKYAWRAKEEVYKEVAKALGVTKAKDTEDNLVFGANSPKPVEIRLNLANGRSPILFADPGQIEDLVVKGSLNGKKYRGQNINSVSIAK